jgi:hypothetical protein
MECPHCREEIPEGEECPKCREGGVPPQEMEIQYKEFKVSELLDIRMASHAPTRERMKPPEPMPGKVDGSNRAAHASKEPSGKKVLLVVTAVIALLAAAAGIYMLRVLF